MTPTELTIYIGVQKLTVSDVAERIKEPVSQVSATLTGLRRNQRIRGKIARLFHKRIDELFGADFEAVVQTQKAAS